ncbi:MAG TPA: PTS system mannose/fructose/sorbose family transporter subunit IID [Candidatus Udaeobacter sp.]|nr:PTS system mannose/fructose/sorbose family transporter subunit IID [Candidatus Udaeobacter sp.]
MRPGAGTLRLFLRGLLLQAGWNRERMQGLGFTFALLPWLPRDPAARPAFIRRHLAYVNTSPPLSGWLLGMVAAEEERLQAEPAPLELEGPAAEVAFAARSQARTETWKRRLESPLAAIGDRIFWGWLRPLMGVFGLFLLLGDFRVGRLPAAVGGQGDPLQLWQRAGLAMLGALALYNGPHLITRLRAVRGGLGAGRGPDPDRALVYAGRGLGLTRMGVVLEWVGPLALGALAGRFLVTLGQSAPDAGGAAPALLLASGILLGAGAGRFRVPPERVAMGALAFLILVTA